MIKKALLVLRLPFELIFGSLYMCSLFLLPPVLRGHGAEIFFSGYLGMPRRVSGPVPAQTEFSLFSNGATIASLLIIAFLVANGLLWFKDVLNIVRKLREKSSD